MDSQELKISFFCRKNNKVALAWADKIKKYVNKKHIRASFVDKNPEVLIVLGGDGTIIEATRKFHHKSNPLILGLNLGNVGFLASVRSPKDFLSSIDKFLFSAWLILKF